MSKDKQDDVLVDDVRDLLYRQAAVIERLVDTVAKVGADLYCLQIGTTMRRSGLIGPEGLRFMGGTSADTFEHVRKRILDVIQGGTRDV